MHFDGRWLERPTWPSILIGVTVATVVAWAFSLPVETIGSRFGGIPETLPSPVVPAFSFAKMQAVLPDAIAFALLAAIHYWFPKFFGRLVPEFWGKLSFWIIFVGFNCTFFPMHFLGLNGMPRRTWTYDANMGWNEGNLFATCGAYLLGVGIFTYFAVLIYTYFKGQKCGNDPWDGRTLEWSIPSPPPELNFAAIPTVHARDGWWYEKTHKEEIAKERAATDAKTARLKALRLAKEAEDAAAAAANPAPAPKKKKAVKRITAG